jgi:hypothetical protein
MCRRGVHGVLDLRAEAFLELVDLAVPGAVAEVRLDAQALVLGPRRKRDVEL